MAKNSLGNRAFNFHTAPKITSFASVAGKKENNGPLSGTFDIVSNDSRFGQNTWEKSESEMQKTCIELACNKIKLKQNELDIILAGDLLNQCIGSTYAAVTSNVPFLSVYGACSTMAETMLIGACMVDGGYADNVCAVASSHFCTAERQYRFPLAYGGQRTPTAQCTATAAGSVIIQGNTQNSNIAITAGSIGQMVDLGINDAANMGAAMAPAAHKTLSDFFRDSNTVPEEYDMILTGDLANIGSSLLVDMLLRDGIDITPVYSDCGNMLYYKEQDVHAGASGCGCSASVVCGSILKQMEQGKLDKIIFAGTGAMMSPLALQQGHNIAGICHLVVIERVN